MANAPHGPIFIADDIIMICAFRYALGSEANLVAHVASWIEQQARWITESDARLIIREIDERAAEGSLGMGLHERRWRCLQARLRSVLAPAPSALAGGLP